MKNQYIGDVGDFGKYGLVRYLQRQNIKIGFNWYFTPDDGSTDGRLRDYLDRDAYRQYDAEAYDEMKRLAFLPDKNIRMVENRGLFDGIVFYDALLDTDARSKPMRDAEREKWHKEALEKLKEADLIFADPDTGLGIHIRAQEDHAQRYILPGELKDYYSRGQDVFYYQHRDRKKSDDWTRQISYMRDVLPDAELMAVSAHAWQMRAYIFVVHPEHKDFYANAIQGFLRAEWGTLKIARRPFFTEESIANI